MAIYYPPAIINAYMQDQINQYFQANPVDGYNSDYTFPFFPTSPTDITALTETYPNGNGRFAVYDRMFRMRKGPFPHIKSEQLLYYFYAIGENAIPFVIETVQKAQDLLDRSDESAEDINNWLVKYQKNNPGSLVLENGNIATTAQIANNQIKKHKTVTIGGTDFMLPHFHSIKVYQLQETRDIINFGTARTYAGNKLIIDYDWHKK